MHNDMFMRSHLLLGDAAMQRLQQARVLLVGVGGVGSWCAESLVRTGIAHLTMADSDYICTSNINRQLMALSGNIGEPKVEAMRQRLLDINPEADINALHTRYTPDNSNEFDIPGYDYVIDAIDSLPDKEHLILTASSCTTLFSSMGAARRIDPTKVTVAEFWKVTGDPLARALRNRFRKQHVFPEKKFCCVYSTEQALCNAPLPNTENANGSLSHVTGIFGLTLAGLVIEDIIRKTDTAVD